MNKWNQLFVRQGWLLKGSEEENVLDCRNETQDNMEFLFDCLAKANIQFTFEKGMIVLPLEAITEDEWIKAVDFDHRGRGEGLWFRPGKEEPKVREQDTYISGVVRQLNRLGYYTSGSCDGHGRRAAHVMITKENDVKTLEELLLALNSRGIRTRDFTNHHHLSLHLSRNELLDLAEKLSIIDINWLDRGFDFIKEQLFRHQLEQILKIPGVSGNENSIREFVIEKLTPHVDHLTVDHAGNILAEKTYRSGNGPTILLNAHLDTVFEFESDRVIVKGENIWSSSKGILGADDRAGVAIILHLAEYLDLTTTTFNGKVKYIFTIEEESGLVGARKVADYFFWDVDASIVADRRGNGDIVTSCGGFIPFCHPRYGSFFEEVASTEGLTGWATTPGGSSDTKIWAQHGIESVNLSAGYMNEHTDKEYLDVEACYNTTKLIIGVLNNAAGLRKILRDIKREQQVVSRVKKAL